MEYYVENKNMNNKFKVLFVYPNVPGSTLVPVNIPILSAVLKENDIDVELFDTTGYDPGDIRNFEKDKEYLLQVKPFEQGKLIYGDRVYEDFASMVNTYKPNLIAVTVVEDTIDYALRLIERVKDYDCPVVVGGVGATFNFVQIFKESKYDIIICIGEGEKSLIQLINSYTKSGGCIDVTIPNLRFKIGKNEVLYGGGKYNELVDLNTLPFPDFSIFPDSRITRVMHGKKFRMLQVEVDRGCPFACTYCCAPALKGMYGQGYYRQKSRERLIQEMTYLSKTYKPDYFDFGSETFLARRDIFDLLQSYACWINIPFWCQGRPETITEDKVKALKAAGCADFQMGIEHGNAGFRREYLNRKDTNTQILEACELLEKYKIPYSVNNIIGWPEETRELVFDTIELNRKINPKTMNCYMMAPYKGTAIRKQLEEEGLIEVDAKCNQLLGGADIKYKYLSKQEFLGLQRCFPLYAKFEKYWWDSIERAEKFDYIGNRIFDGLRNEYIERYYA